MFADVREGETLVCMNVQGATNDSVEGVVSSGLKNSGFISEKDVYCTCHLLWRYDDENR